MQESERLVHLGCGCATIGEFLSQTLKRGEVLCVRPGSEASWSLSLPGENCEAVVDLLVCCLVSAAGCHQRGPAGEQGGGGGVCDEGRCPQASQRGGDRVAGVTGVWNIAGVSELG